jgi:hypothetical protein
VVKWEEEGRSFAIGAKRKVFLMTVYKNIV